MVWAVQKNSAVEMFSQIFLIVFLGCFQSAISVDNHNEIEQPENTDSIRQAKDNPTLETKEIEQRFGAGDILGFKIMDGEPKNGPFTVSTLTIFK